MGEEAFWNAVKDYIKTNLYSIVETGKELLQNEIHLLDDFRKILEKHCGINLIKFFDQWIYGVGYPILEGKFYYNPGT